MSLWKYTFRELARRPGHALVTLTGIAVGAAAAVSALVAADAARGQYRELFEGLAGGSSLEVYAPGEVGFDPAIVEHLCRLPGVRAAVPEIRATGGLPSWRASAAVIVRAHPGGGGPTPCDDVALVPEHVLEAHGLRPGGRLRLWGTVGLVNLTVSVMPPADALRAGSGGFVVVSPATARHLFGLGERINLVRLVLDDGADAPAVSTSVASALPPGLIVRDPAGRADVARGLRAAAVYGLIGLTAVALAAAAYIVYGLAQLNLLARYPELAVLRTLGASTRQVEGLLFRQALVLGAAGGLVGVLGGAGLSWAVLQGAGAASGLALAHPRVGWEAVALGIGLGIALALCGVWLPARRACRTPPLVLLRAGAGPAPGRWSGVPVAGVCFAAGLLLLAGCWASWFSPPVGRALFPPALVLALTGLTGIVAPVLPRALAVLDHPIRFAFGPEGALAVRMLARRPVRAVRACGVSFVALVMVVGFGHTVLNTLADVRGWTERAIPADLLVRGAAPDPGFVLNVALPEALGSELAALDGVARVERIAFIPTTADGTPTLVLARTFAPDQPLPLAVRGDDPEALRAGLARGEAVLAEGLAHALHTGPGGFVTLDTPTGPRRVRVAGVVGEYAAGGGALYLTRAAATELFGPHGVHVFLVAAVPGRQSAAEAAVNRFCTGRGLFLQTNHELRKVVVDLTRGLTAGLWALLAVVVVIAALGTGNAVAALAVELRADVRTLHALGMSSGRIRRLFRVLATLIGTVSVPAGVPCGIALALVLDRVVHGLWGYSVPFRVQWQFLLWGAANAVLPAVVVGAGVPLVQRVRSS
jgi:putative ABC transport system permease protein